jgi:hypothetical protein
MARDDMSASDVPVEGGSSRSRIPLPTIGEDRSVPVKLDAPFATTHLIHSIPGRVRLRVPGLKANSQLARGLQAVLSTQVGITEATVNTGCQSVTLLYDPALWTSESLSMFLQRLSREQLQEYASVALVNDAASPASMNWLQPWRYLTATGSSPDAKDSSHTEASVKSGYWNVGYASMVVGAVLVPVPLVPGIPFLILSSYCFAKATVLKEAEGAQTTEQAPKAKE